MMTTSREEWPRGGVWVDGAGGRTIQKRRLVTDFLREDNDHHA